MTEDPPEWTNCKDEEAVYGDIGERPREQPVSVALDTACVTPVQPTISCFELFPGSRVT